MWSARAAALATVFFGSLLVYVGDARAHPEVDCAAAPYTAWSLVRHGSLDLRYYPEMRPYLGTSVRVLPDGEWVSMRSPGSALVAVPLVAPLALRSEQPPPAETMHQLGKWSAAVAVAWGNVFFFCVCRRLAAGAAWPATILLALGTCLCSVASQALWTHGPATLWVCAALCILTARVGDRFSGGCLAGLALGLAILTRPTTAFFGVATGLTCLVQRRWSATVGLILGAFGPAAYYLWLNHEQFGNALLGGYAADDWASSPPLWLSSSGLLIAPSRGMLIYSPALLLAPLGLFVGPPSLAPDRRSRGLLLAWLSAAAATILFYARWHDWRGGWCYGPRFLCETMPLFCLLFARAYDRLRQGWPRQLAQGLVAVSVAIHLLGLLGYGKGYVEWHTRHAEADEGRCLFSVRDTQIEAHARYLFSQSITTVQKKLNLQPREPHHVVNSHHPSEL